MVLASDYRMDAHLTAWSMQRRPTHTPSSREVLLYELLLVRLWGMIVDINIEERMLYGECLSSEEIVDLAYHLHFRAIDLRELLLAKPLKRSRLYDSFKPVTASSYRRRTSVIFDYLAWLGALGNRALRRLGQDGSALMARRAARLRAPTRDGRRRVDYPKGSIASDLLARRPSARQSRLNTKPTALLEEFALFIALMDRDAIWPRNKYLALRNELILKILAETGVRSGELRQMKISDLEARVRKIAVVRRHNDPESAGRREANAKTFDGNVTVTNETWSLIMEWLAIHEEMTSSKPEPSDFIFISFDHNPLNFAEQISAKGVDDVVKRACSFGEIEALSAHPLRRLKARRIAELVRERNLTEEQARKAITYLMRWADDSNMLAHYMGDASDLAAEKSMRQIHLEREGLAQDQQLKDDD